MGLLTFLAAQGGTLTRGGWHRRTVLAWEGAHRVRIRGITFDAAFRNRMEGIGADPVRPRRAVMDRRTAVS